MIAPLLKRPELKAAKAEAPAGKKGKEEIVIDLAAQGLTASQISKQTGIPYSTVYHHYQKCKRGIKAVKEDGREKKNARREKCRTCIYRGKENGCDYIEHTGHRRGCSVEDCDKYERSKGEKGK